MYARNLRKNTANILSLLLLLLFSVSCCATLANGPEFCSLDVNGVRLPVYIWNRETSSPKGIVLLLHGLTQRACTLDVLAQRLVSDGFLVYGLDERGHGWWHSKQKKSAPGYKCDFKGTVKDVDNLIGYLRQVHPDTPLFLIGESIGAAVAWRSAVDTDAVDGIVVTGSGFKHGRAKFSWILGDVLKNCYRWNHQIKIVRYQLKYGTDDLPAFEDTLQDPEQRKTLTLKEVVAANRFIRKNLKYAKTLDPRTAVLIIQGSDDQVLRPKSARKVFEAANSLDKQLVVIPSCGHILLGLSRVKSLVTDSISDFLNSRTAQAAVAATPSAVPQ